LQERNDWYELLHSPPSIFSLTATHLEDTNFYVDVLVHKSAHIPEIPVQSDSDNEDDENDDAESLGYDKRTVTASKRGSETDGESRLGTLDDIFDEEELKYIDEQERKELVGVLSEGLAERDKQVQDTFYEDLVRFEC
jgi:hypothetical protein